jgi:hypothetical protein
VANRARTEAIVVDTLRQLRSSVKWEWRRQVIRRFFKRPYFVLSQSTKGPVMVNLAGTGITPLWETSSEEPADLDIFPAPTVRRRFSLGQMWTIQWGDTRTSISLLVDSKGRAWLIPRGEQPYPATPDGWQLMIAKVASRFAVQPPYSF